MKIPQNLSDVAFAFKKFALNEFKKENSFTIVSISGFSRLYYLCESKKSTHLDEVFHRY